MKSILTLIACTFFTWSFAQTTYTANDSLSYAMGQDLAQYIKKMELPIQNKILLQAFTDVLEGKPTKFTDDQKDVILRDGMQRIQEEKNAGIKAKAQAFLDANKKNPNVKVTAEGIQYLVLREGTGVQASETDSVVVHYIGSVAEGAEFDNSYERGQPIEITLDNVIEGWKYAIPLMKVGSKYKFFIPYHLGYGERGSGPIPPFSTLIFEVELIDVKKSIPDETA
ncbi:FKBP-type peptidyl-prolyl cis-trans isomerase [Sphingobacterium sp. HJSM2_6]|uniref:FKBP-type peptidyl-prolyl cis-trans isomerase n=1 Tax=Sphingobacterium sp. HJSM2_6 TaxID=3366264 RepID=UPI003BC77B42